MRDTTKSYGYDYNGNCTSVTVGTSVTSISYDYENRVTGITYPSSATNSFAYNGDDMRMQKVDSAGTANYVCDGTTPASPVLSDSSAIYTPGLSERRSSTSKFYHGDALGSTRGITNSSQTVTDSLLFDAFGNTVSRTGTTPTPFGFVGKGQYQTDNDSGLMLLGHRYYDASVGRFISSDPAKAGDNWYAYCDNNPVLRVDSSGLVWWKPWTWRWRWPWSKPPSTTVVVKLSPTRTVAPEVPLPEPPAVPDPPSLPAPNRPYQGGYRPSWLPSDSPRPGIPPESIYGPGERAPTRIGIRDWGSGGSTEGGGGSNAIVTIGEGAGTLASGLKTILPIRQTQEQLIDGTDDGSPAGDPPQGIGWDPNRGLHGGLFGH